MTYLEFYGLQKEPFSVTPDPEFLFMSPSHREALAAIIFGITKRKGIIVITGEVGVGKTTILRSYLEQSASEKLRVVYIFNSDLTFRDLLHEIYRAMDAPIPTDNQHELVQGLYKMLIEQYQKDGNVVLIVDEAQNMPVSTLESLRMLSNLETPKDKLIQLVLIGQPELEEKLDLHELRQLKQRVAMRTRILPLSAAESAQYIEHRLATAGALVESVFASRAVKELVKLSDGVPRIINILSDSALITGFGYQQRPIGPAVVKEVSSDVRAQTKEEMPSRVKWFLLPVAALLLALTLWVTNVQSVFSPAPALAPPADTSALLRRERELRNLQNEAARRALELKKKEEELRNFQASQEQQLSEREKRQLATETSWREEEARRKAQVQTLQRQYEALRKQIRDAEAAARQPQKAAAASRPQPKEQQLSKKQNEVVNSVSVTPRTISSPPASQRLNSNNPGTDATPQSPDQRYVAIQQQQRAGGMSVKANSPAPATVKEKPPEPPETGPEQVAWSVPNSPKLEDTDDDSAIEVAPKILQYVPPSYPYTALMQNLEGIVTVEVLVGEDGVADRVNVVDGVEPGLDTAAIAAVRKWRFSPGTRNGIPTSSWMTYRIAFRLRK